MTYKISFRILCEVYFADVGAFSKTTVAIFSLYDAKILIISRKLPRFLNQESHHDLQKHILEMQATEQHQ